MTLWALQWTTLTALCGCRTVVVNRTWSRRLRLSLYPSIWRRILILTSAFLLQPPDIFLLVCFFEIFIVCFDVYWKIPRAIDSVYSYKNISYLKTFFYFYYIFHDVKQLYVIYFIRHSLISSTQVCRDRCRTNILTDHLVPGVARVLEVLGKCNNDFIFKLLYKLNYGCLKDWCMLEMWSMDL